MQTKNWIGIASAVGAAAVAGGTYWLYRHDLERSRGDAESKKPDRADSPWCN